MSLDAIRNTVRLARSANEWFQPAEDLWRRYRKDSVKESLAQWLNFQNKIIAQSPEPGFLVLSNKSGSNIAAAVVETAALPVVNGARPQAFVADLTTYWYRARSAGEAAYLCALLNAPCVNLAIKPSQTAGSFGERDVTRRPFEICPIPEYDAGDPRHKQLAQLAGVAEETVRKLELGEVGVAQARRLTREAIATTLVQIDALASELLGLNDLIAAHATLDAGDDIDDEEMEVV
jgi:hypothetical protein